MKKVYVFVCCLLMVLLPHFLFAYIGSGESAFPLHEAEDTTQPNPQILLVQDQTKALMAQAVASRTYTLRRISNHSKHLDADICTDSSCCQAFVYPSQYSGSDEELEKITAAVHQTAGQVITYNGKLIEATYFSSSGGQTEDALAVWGSNIPYLRSVPSPGEEASRYHEKAFSFTYGEFTEKLGLEKTVELDEANFNFTYTAGGGVDTMTVGDATFTGLHLRALLGIPSTAFTIDVQQERILVLTRGNGHRVGMSQYGADAMATAGKSYEEILKHYYSGAELETLAPDQIQAIFDKEENL